MRIRKRPNPCSPSSSSSAPSLVVPPPTFPPDPPHGRGGAAGKDSNGVDHAPGTPGLHSDGDLKIRCTQAPYPPSEPHLGVDGSGGGGGRKATASGLAQVARSAAIAKEEEEDGVVDAEKGWDAKINSNFSSSAPLLSAEEQQLSDTALSEKKRGGGKPVEKKQPNSRVGSGAKTAMSSSANNGSSCSRGVPDNDRCEGEAEKRAVGGAAVPGKKRRSPAVLMEGSRCSRVNGRGWRCCQQTLVGYSLCEHHLGKGRLRSVTSVRGQLGTSNVAGKPKIRTTEGPSAAPREEKLDGAEQTEIEEDEETNTAAPPPTARRKKIGIVKARTLSSLLDEENYPLPPSSLPSTMTPPPQPAEVAFVPALDGREAMV